MDYIIFGFVKISELFETFKVYVSIFKDKNMKMEITQCIQYLKLLIKMLVLE